MARETAGDEGEAAPQLNAFERALKPVLESTIVKFTLVSAIILGCGMVWKKANGEFPIIVVVVLLAISFIFAILDLKVHERRKQS